MTPIRYLQSSANLYVSKNFLLWFAITAATLCVIIGFFETIETLRRAMSKPDATIGLIFELSLMVLPQRLMELLPFVVFLSSLLCLWRLNQMHEITALRAMGISGGQLALGLGITALAIGVTCVCIMNPIAASLNNRHAALEERILRQNHQRLTISPTGFWLKEAEDDKKTIFHAQSFSLQDRAFKQVTFYEFSNNDTFQQRIDVKEAILMEHKWKLRDVYIWRDGAVVAFTPELERPTQLTLEKIQRSSIQPHQMPFWRIPAFIRSQHKNGMSTLVYDVYWHRLWADIALLGVMTVLAVGFCLPSPRHHATGRLIGIALCSGFVIHFFNNIIHAYGLGDRMPPFLSAWIPPLITGLLGIGYLLHAEEKS